jgi:RNA polymerase sigma-70 factor (ECF subfamily)
VAAQTTTVVVQQFLDELAGDGDGTSAEPIVRELLASAVARLHMLCAAMLYRSYPRLARPPLNLQSEELLGEVVARLTKALRAVRPGNVRQFFALANQHVRWELGSLARRLDDCPHLEPLDESALLAPGSAKGMTSIAGPNVVRLLAAIESLPEAERETFSLVRVQGMTQVDAAAVLGVSVKTVQRRLNKTLPHLAMLLRDLRPDDVRADAGGPMST